MLRWIEVQPDGFADGATLRGLESQGIDYVARIRNNAVLDRMACPYLRRPPGRPPREGRTWCHELRYQADTWEHARRVVLVVVERPGELLLDYFWLITNLRADRYSGARLLGLYRMRGKAEGHMGELMDVLAPRVNGNRKLRILGNRKLRTFMRFPWRAAVTSAVGVDRVLGWPAGAERPEPRPRMSPFQPGRVAITRLPGQRLPAPGTPRWFAVAVHVSTDYLRPRRRARSPPALAQPTLSPWSASRSDPDHPSQTCRHS